jgi:hypothetical protein
MVFLQGAARRDSPSGACLQLVAIELVELCLSAVTIAEVRDVLSRPELRLRFSFTHQQSGGSVARCSSKEKHVDTNVPRAFTLIGIPKTNLGSILRLWPKRTFS